MLEGAAVVLESDAEDCEGPADPKRSCFVSSGLPKLDAEPEFPPLSAPLLGGGPAGVVELAKKVPCLAS